MSAWPMVPLREVLRRVSDPQPVRADREYPNFGIYSFGRGLFPKQPISGTATSAQTLYRVRRDQFIYSRLFAFEGAYGVVGEQFDGHFVSGEYPTFECDPVRLDLHYLVRYFQRPKTWEQVAALASGMGHRRQRVQPDQFLSYVVPLPSLPEQRRVVERINLVSASIDEARRLREEAHREAHALPNAARRELIGGQPGPDWVPLRRFVTRIENGWSPPCEPRPAVNGQWGVLKVGAVSFGTYISTENKALPPSLQPKPEYEVKPGDFLMSRANTFDLVGACAVVEQTPPRLMLSDKHFRFIFADGAHIDLHYLDHVLKSPALRVQIVKRATGTSSTMKNISKDKVLELLVPNVAPPQQRQAAAKLSAITAGIRDVRRYQKMTAEQLETVMPAVLDQAFRGEL